jgi:hypothetical protein
MVIRIDWTGMWVACGVVRRSRLISPAPQLRFPPLQVFTQRIAQPILAGNFAIIGAFGRFVGHGTRKSVNGFLKVRRLQGSTGYPRG